MERPNVLNLRPAPAVAMTAPIDGELVDAMSDAALCFDAGLVCRHANGAARAWPALAGAVGRPLEEACAEVPAAVEAAADALRTGTQKSRKSAGLEVVAVPRMAGLVLVVKRAPAPEEGLFAADVVGVLHVDDDGVVREANRAACAMLGTDPAGSAWTSLVAADGRARASACAAALAAEGRFPATELALAAADDGMTWALVAGTRGAAGGATLLLVDIAARKAAEEAQAFLGEAGRLLSSSLDYGRTLEQVARLAVPAYADFCFVDVVDEDDVAERLVIAHADPTLREAAQELRKRYVAPRNAAAAKTMLRNRLVAGDGAEGDAAALAALGARSCIVVPMVARQRLVGFLTFASTKWSYDARATACAEELARRAALSIDNARLYRDAQRALRAREDFLSTASHELKTPLTALQLQVHAIARLKKGEEVNREKLIRHVELMERQVERQRRLVDTLLDVSRIGADRLALESEDFDVAKLVRELPERFAAELAETGVKLEIHGPRELPAFLDRVRVEQIVGNLVSNAIKYGAGRPVDVEVGATGDELEIVVRDQGIGIPVSEQGRIFEQFERAVSHRHYSGFGLGLWITNQVVSAMGGEISVRSAEGEGSTFVVRLPRRGDGVLVH